MNDGVADEAVGHDDLLHHREAEALRDASFDLADDRQRVQRPADVLRGRDLHDPHEAELDVDVDDGAVGDERERHVARALAALVELLGRPVPVLTVSSKC